MTFFDTSEQQCKDAFIKAGFWPNEVMWSAKSEELRKQEPVAIVTDQYVLHLPVLDWLIPAHNGRELVGMKLYAAPIPPVTSCKLGCTTECKAKAHGCASECPVLPWQPDASLISPIPTPSQQEALSENLQNLRKALSSNKTGLLGASWHKGRSKFQAQIVINRKNHHLGYFDNVQTAHHAYLKAKQKLHPFAPSILEGK